MDNKEILESISKRLGVLIALKISERSENPSVSEGVELLSRFGLTNSDIADILGTTPGTVNVTKNRLNKSKKK